MKKFALMTKSGEVINTTSATNKIEAAENFAAIKKMSLNNLLEIFEVELFIR
jgi:hypothetical protein